MDIYTHSCIHQPLHLLTSSAMNGALPLAAMGTHRRPQTESTVVRPAGKDDETAKPSRRSGSLKGLRDHREAGNAKSMIMEGRKSTSGAEMSAARVAASLQVKVAVADMPEFMQVHAFQCARRAYYSMDKFSSKQMAHDIKKEFDKVYGPTWHCIVGTSFGSFVTHSSGCFLYFSMEKILVMVFRTRATRVL